MAKILEEFDTTDEAKRWAKENKIKYFNIKMNKDGKFKVYKKERPTEVQTSGFYLEFSTIPYINIAKQLNYPDKVIEELEQCIDANQASIILSKARRTYL